MLIASGVTSPPDLCFMEEAEQISWSYALYLFAVQWLLQWVLVANYSAWYSPILAFWIFLLILEAFVIRVVVYYQNLLSGKSKLAE